MCLTLFQRGRSIFSLNHSPTSSPACGQHHDRNLNAAHNLLKLALLAVGENVMLPDGVVLAGRDATAGETAPREGRTKPGATGQYQIRLAL